MESFLKSIQLQSPTHFFKTALQQADQRRDLLHHNLVEAQSALSAAQNAVTTLQAELSKLDTVRAELRNGLDAAASLVVRALPDDILRIVFSHFVDAFREPSTGCDFLAAYSVERARAPYTVAAVCKTWRRVALDNAVLWTYIGINVEMSIEEEYRACAAYAHTNIARSKSLDVDVSIQSVEEDALPMVIVRELAACATRWRSMSLTLCTSADLGMDLLRLTTPALRELELHAQPPFDPLAGYFEFLPHCPLLRRFGCVVADGVWEMGQKTLVHLVFASLQIQDIPIPTLWAALALAPNLDQLRLNSQEDTMFYFPVPESSVLVLSALRHLTLVDKAGDQLALWSSYMDFPLLETLELAGRDLTDTFNLITHFAPTVTTLKVHLHRGLFGVPDVELFEPMTKLRHITINGVCSDEPRPLNIIPSAFQRIMEQNVWPALETMQFANGEMHAASAEGLVALVKHRNRHHLSQASTGTADDGSCPPLTRLRSVHFDAESYSIPFWLPDQLAFFLNDETKV